MKKILLFMFSLMFIACSFFRKTSKHSEESLKRDSIAQIDSTGLNYTFNITGSNKKLYQVTAKGFQSVKVGTNGEVQAVGENGELNVTGGQEQNNNAQGNLKASEVSKETAVHDSTTIKKDSSYQYEAKPDNWSIGLFVILGVVVIIIIILVKFK